MSTCTTNAAPAVNTYEDCMATTGSVAYNHDCFLEVNPVGTGKAAREAACRSDGYPAIVFWQAAQLALGYGSKVLISKASLTKRFGGGGEPPKISNFVLIIRAPPCER